MDLVVDPAGGMQWTLEEQKSAAGLHYLRFPPRQPLSPPARSGIRVAGKQGIVANVCTYIVGCMMLL